MELCYHLWSSGKKPGLNSGPSAEKHNLARSGNRDDRKPYHQHMDFNSIRFYPANSDIAVAMCYTNLTSHYTL